MFSFSMVSQKNSLCLESLWELGIYYYEIDVEQTISLSLPFTISNVCMKYDSTQKMNCLSSENNEEREAAISEAMETATKAISVRSPFVVIRPEQLLLPSTTSPSEEDRIERKQVGDMRLEGYCRALFTLSKSFPEITFCILPASSWNEFPYIPELRLILSDLANEKIAYWHNTASACLLEKEQICEQGEWIDVFANNVVGIHWEDLANDSGIYANVFTERSISHLRSLLPKNIVEVIRLRPNCELFEVSWTIDLLHK
ncbi:MAG: hypothetical protein KBC30_03930 [Planctomycetes bacterium]|nr:hypothetical protein [Planctomycetota bacterium]HON45452.1 hypothetical protein [Planctomycetota bacterium]HPY74437.1 hypothetical protein [Planctomycetota bacterium]HQA99988.1 hypothetical protein [Planctomycetota bacterium]HRU50917.1 hypothetical protein [Planctomycetota bacterium]